MYSLNKKPKIISYFFMESINVMNRAKNVTDWMPVQRE